MGIALVTACGKGTEGDLLSSGSAGAGKQKVAPNSAKANKAIDEEIRYRLNKPTSKLTPEDAAKIEELVISEHDITDLTPFMEFKNLEKLVLYRNPVSDLTPLKGLSRLKDLQLYNNQITDLTPLKGLTELNHLNIRFNQIFDLTPLYGLKKLNRLDVRNNPELTKTDIKQFKEALPRCYLIHSVK
jgi:internalin A